MKKSVENVEHYNWGAQCSGWHLVKTEALSVIQELMPEGSQEATHFHRHAQQFIYILKGAAVFEVEGKLLSVQAHEGIHIRPGAVHQIRNEGVGELHFLVISQPAISGDRFDYLEKKSKEAYFNGRQFRPVFNTTNGDVGEGTIFHYRQKGNIIWATYEGGSILFGTLSGKINDQGHLEFTYQHQNLQEEFLSGKCLSTPEILEDGRIRLYEKWQWTCKDGSSGESVLEEII